MSPIYFLFSYRAIFQQHHFIHLFVLASLYHSPIIFRSNKREAIYRADGGLSVRCIDRLELQKRGQSDQQASSPHLPRGVEFRCFTLCSEKLRPGAHSVTLRRGRHSTFCLDKSVLASEGWAIQVESARAQPDPRLRGCAATRLRNFQNKGVSVTSKFLGTQAQTEIETSTERL